MIKKPELVALEDLEDFFVGHTASYCSAAVAQQVYDRFQLPRLDNLSADRSLVETLVVVGGGTRMDTAKRWRADISPETGLIIIPSLWGSGAEVSPVVTSTLAQSKEVSMGERYLPDIRSVWPELAAYIPNDAARYACGDAWSHAIEGFLSPLATERVQSALAAVILDMTRLPLSPSPEWFELSARACAGQAQAGVGLVHGIAHTLEPVLQSEGEHWGHARLCSTYLWPVLCYNRHSSRKADELAKRYALNFHSIDAQTRALFDPEAYNRLRPTLIQNWKRILRDPCTRVNSTLVRPSTLEYLCESDFS